jgi:hypothetical protein
MLRPTCPAGGLSPFLGEALISRSYFTEREKLSVGFCLSLGYILITFDVLLTPRPGLKTGAIFLWE